jgi:hypothetical protein
MGWKPAPAGPPNLAPELPVRTHPVGRSRESPVTADRVGRGRGLHAYVARPIWVVPREHVASRPKGTRGFLVTRLFVGAERGEAASQSRRRFSVSLASAVVSEERNEDAE